MGSKRGVGLAAQRALHKKSKKNAREKRNTFFKGREPCLLVIDNPSINSIWYGDITDFSAEVGETQQKHRIFPYHALARSCKTYLKQTYQAPYTLESVVFANQREHQELGYLRRLAEDPGWSLFRKPKVGSSDIDENIQQFIDFYLETVPVMHVFMAGNDLRNHGPIADRLVSENIGVTLLCFFDEFYNSTVRSLQEETRYDSYDIREFIGM